MNYDELPTRGKETSTGVTTSNHHCGGRTYVFYEENRLYAVWCKNCGRVLDFKRDSLDSAILKWNEIAKERRIIDNYVRDTELQFNEINDYLDEKISFERSYFSIIKNVLLKGTGKDGGSSTREKCKELGLDYGEYIVFGGEREG